MLLGFDSLAQNETGRTPFSFPLGLLTACGGFGGKGIDLAALDPCFALELRSHPQKGFDTPAGETGGKGIRTPGLLIANETRYQLRHSPLRGKRLASDPIRLRGG